MLHSVRARNRPRRLLCRWSSALRAQDPNPQFRASPKADILHWEAELQGPSESPFAGGTPSIPCTMFTIQLPVAAGTFQLSISFPESYPFKPPTVKFSSKIYHPNVR